jgi:3'-5' exonuclease
MLEHINIEKILFLDIETVPQLSSYDELPEKMKLLWDNKCKFLTKDGEPVPSELYGRAGIYAEFGKIICISVGVAWLNQGQYHLRIKSFAGDDEQKLLLDFCDMINSHYKNKNFFLCAHNGKEFDFPYLSRRMLVNSVKLPVLLDCSGKKPWEVPHLDTMELWRFGDYKNYTSLELLAAIFNIPTPKDDISGSMVGKTYWEEKNLPRIIKYCQKDVVTIVQLLLRYKNLPLIVEENIVIVNS